MHAKFRQVLLWELRIWLILLCLASHDEATLTLVNLSHHDLFQVYAITGGASGMGAATARLLAQRGASAICIADILNPSTEVGCQIIDVSSSESVDNWINGIITTFGDLHGVANVAGLPQPIGARGIPAIAEETDSAWDKILGVNLNGVFYCTRAAIRAMKELPPASDRGIVNVASMASLQHNPDAYAYRASKAGCAHFTQSVAKDTIALGIRTSPGVTNTPMLDKFFDVSDNVKKGYLKSGWTSMRPEDVARMIVWLLSEDSKCVFGANINVGAAVP
ncbi:short chain dehydrogenase/oxidoreductase CpoX2 [Aspergillus granulosus]|uniref:Short chain dehydrogenase/oxidoreductase CpoX2 n=1 Tax=Aspergillus granulosus TaxID=176169 RepID=A0ABR4GUD0_9EURO